METVALTLPEVMMTQAREIANQTGRTVEAVLIEWLERSAELDISQWITPGTVYPVYTLYGNEEAAQVLGDFLKSAEVNRNTE